MSVSASEGSEPLLTIADFAAVIGKTERQVYRYVKQGRVRCLTPEQTGLSGIRIPAAECQKFGSSKPRAERRPYARTSQFSSSERQPRIVETGPDMSDNVMMEPETGGHAQYVPLDRHEAAVMRLGYLERELEQTRRMLTEGGENRQELVERLTATEQRLTDLERVTLEAELKVIFEREERQRLEASLLRATERLVEAERAARRSWWQRLLGS